MNAPTQMGLPQGGPGAGVMPFGGPGPGPRGGLLMLPPVVMIGLLLVGGVITAVAFWQIMRKAGYPGVLGLLMLVPLVNYGVMLWVAFSEWPTQRRLREAEATAALTVEAVS